MLAYVQYWNSPKWHLITLKLNNFQYESDIYRAVHDSYCGVLRSLKRNVFNLGHSTKRKGLDHMKTENNIKRIQKFAITMLLCPSGGIQLYCTTTTRKVSTTLREISALLLNDTHSGVRLISMSACIAKTSSTSRTI